MFPLLFLQRSLDEKGDLLGVDRFSSLEGPMGAATDPLQNGRDFLSNDMLTDLLMVGFEMGEVLFIEKVAERPMANIMEQTREAEQFLDIKRGWDSFVIDL
jgi:hypothetical protein